MQYDSSSTKIKSLHHLLVVAAGSGGLPVFTIDSIKKALPVMSEEQRLILRNRIKFSCNFSQSFFLFLGLSVES